ncbi:hypothetical protein ACN38_g10747 [Penicillium nordicum]|uniref:Uncharacterized protein n=1 Tax=Penicillium nordicum TaxID=229535 RepID=A0A0M9WBB7_9EURO|nr:hypothetical protein ACN38_g10747 [Penicillium nordicum]
MFALFLCLQRSSTISTPLDLSLYLSSLLLFFPSLLFSFNALFHSKTWLVTPITQKGKEPEASTCLLGGFRHQLLPTSAYCLL